MQIIKSRRTPHLSKRFTAILGATLIGGSVNAGEPIPNTFTDVSVPQLTGWNDSNIATVDGVTGATDKSYVYESAAAKADPNIGAFAAVYWELDNDSGRAPGIQVVTDDLDVPTNNCIMASGEIESKDFPGTIVPKTCSDAEGSSKRYFFELTSADVPVDLAFNLGVKDIRYKGVKDPSTDNGEELAEFRDTYGIGRIYRVIQKVINNTDKRIASYKFELGTGVGPDFTPLTFDEHTVAFEMSTVVPREFFEGETGAPDISVWNPLRFATISPKMFDDGARARFEPGFLDHAAAGFLPPQLPAEGVMKSQSIDSGLNIVNNIIGSMTPNYFNIQDTQNVVLPGNMMGYHLPDSLIPTVIGEYNTNEIGGESDAIVAIWDGVEWRSGRSGLDGDPATTPDNYGPIPLSQLQQWAAKPLGLNIPGEAPEDIIRYESILSDDLSGLNTDMYIYVGDKLIDDLGDLKLDSITLRVTANSVDSVIGNVVGSEDPLWVQMGNEPPTLASYMPATGTPVAINDVDSTEETDPVTINVLDNDLLDGAPLVAANGTITITAQPVDGAVVVDNVNKHITYTANAGFTGTEFISYTVTLPPGAAGDISNEATVKIEVYAALIPDAPIANNDSAAIFMDSDLTIDVLVNDDLNKYAPTSVVVAINNAALNGVATVGDDNVIAYTPNTGFIGFERFTYTVTVDGYVSNSALVTVRVDDPLDVEPEPEAEPSAKIKASSGGGCSAGGSDGRFDPILPGMLLFALIGLYLNRRKNSI